MDIKWIVSTILKFVKQLSTTKTVFEFVLEF